MARTRPTEPIVESIQTLLDKLGEMNPQTLARIGLVPRILSKR